MENVIKVIVIWYFAIFISDMAYNFRVAAMQMDKDKLIKKDIGWYKFFSFIAVASMLYWLFFKFNILERI